MSHQLPGAIPSLRSGTVIVDELEESSDGDVEDELLPELVDNPGTRRGAKLSVLLMIVFPSFDPLIGGIRGFSQLSNRWDCRRFFE